MQDTTKLIQLFFHKPMTRFGVRELSRQTHLDTKTVMKYLKNFTEQKLITKHTPLGKFPHYEANRLSLIYRIEKSHILVRKILESGLVEYLEKQCHPQSLVLFGSVKKGTYHEKSDVDIFVQAPYKLLDLTRFETHIEHPISLIFEPDIKMLSSGLRQNIYNGLILAGGLPPI